MIGLNPVELHETRKSTADRIHCPLGETQQVSPSQAIDR